MIKNTKKKKLIHLFWIFLLGTIFIYINGMPIIPIGLVVVVFLISFNVKWKKTFISKKINFLSLLFVGFLVGLSGIGFFLNLIFKSQSFKMEFNLWFTPVNIIKLVVPEINKENLIFNNNQFTGDVEEGNKIALELLDSLNNKNYDILDDILYLDINQTEIEKFKNQIINIASIVGEVTHVEYKGYLRSNNETNNGINLIQKLYFTCFVEKDPNVKKELVVSFVKLVDGWKVFDVRINANAIDYYVSEKNISL